MKSRFYSRIYWLALVMAIACKETYTPPAITANNSKFLIVEGYINISNDSTIITLTHTRNLNSDSSIAYEPGAAVAVESDDGAVFNLTEVNPGVYSIAAINGSTTAKYRLTIATRDGKQFSSDYVEYKHTPAIDTITWEQQADGVHIYVNTHDDAGLSKYYGWEFTETYEYHAPFDALFKVVNGSIVPRPAEEQIFKCWRALPSTSILIASTSGLSGDVVYKKPIQFIPQSTEKLGVTYSILLRQHALTQQGYNYWQQVSKNTESLGTLFDPLPFQVQGNIHCTTDASETVIGYITASDVSTKRLFISKAQLGVWEYPPYPYAICDTVHLNTSNTPFYLSIGYIPIQNYDFFNVYAAPSQCGDCREKGGTTTKPDFWP